MLSTLRPSFSAHIELVSSRHATITRRAAISGASSVRARAIELVAKTVSPVTPYVTCVELMRNRIAAVLHDLAKMECSIEAGDLR